MNERSEQPPSVVKLPTTALEPVEPVERGTLVRVFSPIGHYWRGAFRDSRALYFGGTELVFAACHFDEAKHSGEYYSEFDDPSVEEVLLQSALSLPVGWDGGVISLYPYPWTARIPDQLDLADPKVTEDIGNMILSSEVVPSYQLITDPAPPLRRAAQRISFEMRRCQSNYKVKYYEGRTLAIICSSEV